MRTKHVNRLAAVAIAVASSAMMPHAAAAGDAAPTACWVKNVRTQAVTSDLRSADYRPGDVLRLRGVCENVTIGVAVTLVGPATIGNNLNAGGGSGMMVTIGAGATVRMQDLTITNGASSWDAGGILNEGTLILKGTTSVAGNWAEDAAGGIDNYGVLVMNDRSSVRDNSVLNAGTGRAGGIRNVGTLVMNDWASVSGNYGGGSGGGVHNEGRMVMREHARVVGNDAETGGGVDNVGTLVLRDSATITHNSATAGGGIHDEGTVRFARTWQGTVCGNVPDDWGRCEPCTPTA